MTRRRSRITDHEIHQLNQTFSDLDWKILAEIRKFRLLATRQIQHVHFGNSGGDERRCQRNLARLTKLGVLYQLPRRVGGRGRGSDSTVYRLGRVGRRLLDESVGAGPSWQPSATFAAHTLGIADLYVQLRNQKQLGQLQLREFTPEPEAWRTFTWQMKPVTLKPDAHAIVEVAGIQHYYFIELDLGTESTKVIENKISRYLDYYQSGPDLSVFPQVLFLVDSKHSYHARDTSGRIEQIETVAEHFLPGGLSQLVTVHAKNHPPWTHGIAA